jgi:TolA-binding protein
MLALVAVIGFAGYRFYSERRDSTASALLSSATRGQDYEQLIARYSNTPAGAAAYLLLARSQRNEKKFAEANATLRVFIDKYPKHELVATAQMAVAANLESVGNTDEALSMYQQIAARYPTSFDAPLALISQVPLLKTIDRIEDARRVCETILTQYPESIWAGEAMRQLRSLKPSSPSKPAAPTSTIPPMLAAPSVPPNAPRPPSGAPTPRPNTPR